MDNNNTTTGISLLKIRSKCLNTCRHQRDHQTPDHLRRDNNKNLENLQRIAYSESKNNNLNKQNQSTWYISSKFDLYTMLILSFFLLVLLSVSDCEAKQRYANSYTKLRSLFRTVPHENPHPIVTLDEGRIQGIRYQLDHLGLSGDAFLGIPFAEPPVGDLRFQYPVPVAKWNRVIETTTLPNSCHQLPDTFYGPDFRGSNMWNTNTRLSEDCLYINVWVPHSPSKSDSNPSYPNDAPTDPYLAEPPNPYGYRDRDRRAREKKAVMVWIFGGGFYSGSTTLELYDGKILASLNDVIVVSVAYRIGVLGFLCLNTNSTPCNVGLYDQLAGLDWVRRNIKYFGGDPDKVTLFGESAGSASVSLHLLSPYSRPLFHRAILQSGAANMPWAVLERQEARRRSVELALQYLKCPAGRKDDEAIAACLRSATPQRLVEEQWISRGILQFPFLPIVDGLFLPEPPLQALKAGRFKHCPILAGSNQNEGSWFIIYELSDKLNLTHQIMTRDDFLDSIQKLFFYYPQYPSQLNSTFALNAIEFQYTDWSGHNDTLRNLAGLDAALADFYFLCPMNEYQTLFASEMERDLVLGGDDNPVYTYYLTERYSSNPWPEWTGVLHGDDILFMFGEPLKAGANFTERERRFSIEIMKYWTNFAKTGDPNMESLGQKSNTLKHWPRFTSQGRQYMELNSAYLDYRPSINYKSDHAYIGRGPRINQCAFWQHYLPQLKHNTARIDEREQTWLLQFEEWRRSYMEVWKTELRRFEQQLAENCLK